MNKPQINVPPTDDDDDEKVLCNGTNNSGSQNNNLNEASGVSNGQNGPKENDVIAVSNGEAVGMGERNGQDIVGASGGARPKVRRHVQHRSCCQPTPHQPTELDSSDSESAVSKLSDHSAANMRYHMPRTKSSSLINGNALMCSSETDEGEADNVEDTYIYTYKGSFQSKSDNYLSADLPKSFYPLDVGSDSEGGGGAQLGVSFAGQSNLSTEVAALIQSEMASLHATNELVTPGLPQQAQHDEMDFLEMDLDESDVDSDRDSGQGGDENVTETNEEDSDADAVVQQSEANKKVPDSLPLQAERGEPTKASRISNISDQQPEDVTVREEEKEEEGAAEGGVTSVPAVTPVGENLSFMVRSRSLNSPISTHKMRRTTPNSGCLMERGESEPEVSSSSSRSVTSQRHFSGDSQQRVLDLLNMELCGARLCQRQLLVFGVPPADAMAAAGGVTARDDSLAETSSLTEKTLIWTELEACQKQVSQIGPSACGATAVINVLLALKQPHSVEEVNHEVKTRQRAPESKPLTQYLISRSIAGTSHQDLESAVQTVSKGEVCSRFFHMFPQRRIHLLTWLEDWLKKGAVPIATLNKQRGVRPGQCVPDAWHHQMIFGVGPSGVYLTNPLELASEDLLKEQLCSPSVLLVRREDILHRYKNVPSDLSTIKDIEDERWDELNVLGQVVNVLREDKAKVKQQGCPVSHVRIPAAYKSGITLFISKSSPHAADLTSARELPLHPSLHGEMGAASKL